MVEVVVVGGGPAGLAAAYRLTRRPGHAVTVLERAPTPGGLAAGFRHGPYILDYGPHRLHPAIDPEVLADLRALLGAELQARPRHGRIFLGGRYLTYPLGPSTLLQVGPRRAIAFGGGLLAARLTPVAEKLASYEEALRARLGSPLYEQFYGPYAEKVWGLPGSRIAADQAELRVNQRGVLDLLRLVAGRANSGCYLYPEGGFGRIPGVYADRLHDTPSARVLCSATVDVVRWSPGRVDALGYAHEGRAVEMRPDHVVWTAPIADLVRRLDPPAPPDVRQALERLRYRALVLAYVVLAVPRVGSADTYYFPERRFPFNRVTEQKNFSPALVPPERTVLCLDITCDPGDAVHRASDEAIARLVLPALEEAGLARPEWVVEVFTRRFAQAYPRYEIGYREALQTAMDWLAGLENLWLIGRQGRFLHNNTHHALLMGYRAADVIASGGDRATWAAATAEFHTFRVAD
ncbi:MAG TPA: FAD-dependent oxidoreductase [Chloroflexota bacterium]